MSDSILKGLKVPLPKWDGERDTFAQYYDDLVSVLLVYECEEAIDGSKMAECPTKAQYDSYDATSVTPSVIAMKKLYVANERAVAIIQLGQASAIGKAEVKITKDSDFPKGRAWVIIDTLKEDYLPKDASAGIEMKNELERVAFTGAQEYYAAIVQVQARYEVQKSQEDLLLIMASKVSNTTYAKIILDHLNDTSKPNSLKQVCREIKDVQKLAGTKLGGAGRRTTPELQLGGVNPGPGNFQGVCGNCKKVCGYKRKDCPHEKANGGAGGGGSNNRNADKNCNHCGSKGHVEATCWKKFPEKAPAWMQEKLKKAEVSNANVELVVAHVDANAYGYEDTQDFGGARR